MRFVIVSVLLALASAQWVSETTKHLRDRENGGRAPVTVGYIPAGTQSGVTISSGIDLGQQSERGLRNKGVSQTIINKMKPYLGLRTPRDVKNAGLKAANLKLTNNEALQLESAFVNEVVRIVSPFSKHMGAKGEAVLASLRHWAGALGNTRYDGKLAMHDGKRVVNHVYDAIKGKRATLAQLKTALQKTLALHRRRSAAYNRIKHEIDYIG